MGIKKGNGSVVEENRPASRLSDPPAVNDHLHTSQLPEVLNDYAHVGR
ncbi:MAG TPA: hypothetical protein VEF72_07085 [Mycobacterium sp.]|nr:hypothetical protein [Mycobacterium sp.]